MPYQLADGGATVLVPQSQVYDLRVSLSGKGLPASTSDGYSILDGQGMTATDLQQNVAYQRALELATTLQAISGVQTAIVHLAIPKKDVFSSEQDRTTASVLLSLPPGTTLNRGQVRAVTHLVGSSIPGLDPGNVTVTDGKGTLLSGQDADTDGAASLAGDTDERTAQFEDRMSTTVQAMLDQVLGPGHAVVRVNAQLSYDTRSTTSERQVVEDLTAEIVRLRDISPKDAEAVLDEAYRNLHSANGIGRGGLDLARQLLAESVGEERAEEIMERLGATLAEMPFEVLRRADARQLRTFLADEHPQTVALVLAHLSPQQSAIVLSGFEQKLQADIAHRIALMERANPEVIRIVERELDRRMSTVLGPQEMSAVGGVAPLVAIINRTDRSTERMILEGLETVSPELAEQVRAQMFIFEDITTLEDKAIQLVLRNVESSDLALALKGVSTGVREKIMRNLSTRAAENLAEEIEVLGPKRLSEVEEAQAKVVNEIRALEQAGQIVIMRGSDEALVD